MDLVCAIIALAIQLSRGQRLKSSVLERLVQKSSSDLKNYFKEIGITTEIVKHGNKPELMLYWNTKSKRVKEEEEPVEVDDINATQTDNDEPVATFKPQYRPKKEPTHFE